MPIQNASVMMKAELFVRFGLYDTQLRRTQDFELFLGMYQHVTFKTTGPLIRYRTTGLVERWSMVRENNLRRR
jgi:hypothetical protein